MVLNEHEENLLRSVALQNARAVMHARERAEDALRQSETRFRAIFQQAAVGITITSLEGRFEEMNGRFCQILGYPPEELQRLTFLDLTDPEDRSRMDASIRRLRSGEISDFVIEKRCRRKDSSIAWTLTSVTILKDSSGRPDKFIGIVEDISDRKHAEQAAARLAAVVESSDDAIISMGLDTIIITWNRGAERTFGYTAAEAIGKSVTMLIPADSEDEEPRILRRLLDGERIDHYETIRQRKDGVLLNVSLTVSPIYDSTGKIVGVSKISRDITERKRAEIALREAQAELRRHAETLEQQVADRTAKLRETIHELEAFSYSVSHDMRSPLRAMQGYSDALLADHKSKLDPTAQQYLTRISRAAARMDLLIQDVLAYSRVAKGEVQLTAVDLEHVIADVIQHYPALEPARASIRVHSPLPRVLGHEAYLTQIASNLLTNAVKFVRPGTRPEVEVRATVDGEMVRVGFRDNGIGIAPEHQKQIFQIFGRVYSEKNFEGTGIGLAIAKKAAERMGGSIGVSSEFGRGSEFFVLLRRAT
jgi:PAS domain S-box-containing protein